MLYTVMYKNTHIYIYELFMKLQWNYNEIAMKLHKEKNDNSIYKGRIWRINPINELRYDEKYLHLLCGFNFNVGLDCDSWNSFNVFADGK